MANGGKKKGEQALILGGAVVATGGFLSWLFKWPPEVWGQAPGNVQVTVTPADTQVGTPVAVSATFKEDNGAPRTVAAAYMRVKNLLGVKVYELPAPQANVNILNATIPTTGMQPGDYTVEVADNPNYS